jgi:hypothetical protein
MSIFGPANTVTAADIAGLEDSLQFFQSSAANQQTVAGSIQAGNTTVAAYAAQLLNANISFSQVAMGVSCIELGVAQTTAELDTWSTGFLPAQVTNAINHGFNPTVYAAESLGLALAGEPEFAAFTGLNATQFAQQVSTLTGVNQAVIQTWVANWTHFYTPVAQGGIGGSTFGLSITAAAYGAALGDAVGVALLNPTSANLQTVISTNAQGETVIQGDVANHLLDIATGQYTPGTACGLLPQHTPLQGEAGSSAGGLKLTIDVDHLTATTTGAIFDGSPAGNPPLGTTNTLNTGDVLIDSFGDGTLNYTAVHTFFGANDPFAQGVTMDGISDVFITNLAEGGEPAGFAGNITGLLNLTIVGGSTSDGDVQVGSDGAGLHTALETLTINGGIHGGDVNIWIDSGALTGAELLDINLSGVDVFVDINVTGGTNTYGELFVHSNTAANHIDLDAVVPTVTVDGDQHLEICGDALNQDSLETFNASAASGGVEAFFDGPDPGGVAVTGGDGDDDFWFLTLTGTSGETTFTTDDTVDGGGGSNKLWLQAFEGALLGAGVGANITNIDTIVHTTYFDPCFEDCSFQPMTGDLTVDAAEAGSATALDLQGWYDFNDVTVDNIGNDFNVIVSGFELDDLNLSAATVLGDVHLTLAQDECVQQFDSTQTTLLVEDVNLISGGALIIESTGAADLNQVHDFDDEDADVEIVHSATGDVDLTLGTKFAPYNFDGGVVDAHSFEANLTLFVGAGHQTVFGGLGDDTIDVVVQNANEADHFDLSAGGNDTVVFEDVDTNDGDPLTSANYTTITGFEVANDTIAIDVLAPFQIDLQSTNGNDVAPGDAVSIYPLIFGVDDDLSNVDVNFIKFALPVSSVGFDFQETFDFYMGVFATGTDIDVDANANLILMAMYDTNGGNMVLFTVEPDTAGTVNQIDDGDDVDMIALVPMSQADYDAFGTTGLSFVNFPAVP